MSNKFRRVSIAGLMVLTVIATMGFNPRPAKALVDGDLVKGPNSDAVYYINGNSNTKHVFPDAKTYFTWYSNFDGIQSVSIADLDAWAAGSAVPYRAGTKLVTHANTANVYAAEPNGTLRMIPDEASAKALYGANWAKKVSDVHELTFGNYMVGTPMTSAMHAAGTLLSAADDPGTIYYYDGTEVRPFADSDAFDMNNFNADFVVDVASVSGYGTPGSSITGAESFATISGTGGTSVITPAGTLSVSLSPNTPAANLAVENAARMPFTTIRLQTGSNPVTIDQMIVERGGAAQDAAFSSIDILNGTTMIPFDLNSKSFNSNHQATFNKDVTIPANTTMDIVLAANFGAVLDAYAGQVPALGLVGMTLTGGSTVNGTLPIFGNGMTINHNIAIGSATIQRGSYTNATSTNLEVGKTDYTFFSFQIQAGSVEDVTFNTVSIYQEGNADFGTDLTNIRLLRDGTVLTNKPVIDGRYAHFSFDPLTIPKGQTFQFQSKADVASGSSSTVTLGIYRNTDLLVKGKTHGYNITPTYSGTGSSSAKPYLSDNQFTIGAGTLTIERDNSVGADNVSVGNDQVLGAFKFTVKGEPIDITAATLTINSTTANTTADPLTGIRLVNPSGTVVAGPTDVTANATTVAFTDTFTAPTGVTIYKVIGNINSTGQWATDDTIFARWATAASAITAEGTVTGDTITASPASNVDTNTQTIKAAKLQVSRNTVPSDGNLVAGAQDVVLGSWNFDASDSGENVRITSVVFAASSTNVDNLTLKVNGTVAPPIQDAPTKGDGESTTFAVDDPIIITKGTQATVTLEGDVSSSAKAGEVVQFGLTDTLAATNASVVAYGVSTGNRGSVTVTADNGPNLTVQAAGQVTVTTDNNPPKALVRAGSTGVVFGHVKFDALYEGLDLDDLRIWVEDGGIDGAAAGNYQDSLKAYVFDGSTQLGSISIPSTGNYKWTFANGTLTVPNEQYKVLTIKSDMAGISSSADNSPGTPGADIRFGFGGANSFKFTGNGSNQTATEVYNGSTSTAMIMHKSIPTITFSSAADRMGAVASLTPGPIDLYKFKVAASSGGNEVLFYRVTFEIATGGSGVISVSNCVIKDGNGGNITTETTPSDREGSATNDLSLTFNDPDLGTNSAAKEAMKIAAGSSETFTLNCTMGGGGLDASGDFVQVALVGDNASTTPDASHGTPAASNANVADAWGQYDGSFTWSDNYKNLSLTAEGANANATNWGQWYNGYLVPGLGEFTTTTAYTVAWPT